MILRRAVQSVDGAGPAAPAATVKSGGGTKTWRLGPKWEKLGKKQIFLFFFVFFPQNHMTVTSVMKKGQIHSFKDSVNIAHSKYSVLKKKKKHTSRFSFWLFEGLNYTYHTDKPVVEPGDQRLKSNAFLFCFGHPYKRNEKPQLHRSLGDVQTEKHTHTPFLSLPSTPHHDCPRFSVLGRQALLVSVCRIQRVTRRGEGRCVSQSERA